MDNIQKCVVNAGYDPLGQGSIRAGADNGCPAQQTLIRIFILIVWRN